MLIPILVTPPVAKPLTLEEVKSHLNLNEGQDGNYVDDLIDAVADYFERILGIGLITQTWRIDMDAWPDTNIELPFKPIQSVTAVKYWYTTQQTLADTNYRLHKNAVPPYLAWTSTASLPTAFDERDDAISVEFVVGYGLTSKDVPASLHRAALLMIGHWYENRETVVLGNISATDVPHAAMSLASPHRRMNL